MTSLRPKRPPNRYSINKKILIITVVGSIILAGVIASNLPTITTEESRKVIKQNITPLDAAKQFNPQNALDFSAKICGLGPRYNGNNAELKAAEMTEAEFKRYGLNVTKEKVDLGHGRYTYNVIGKIEGSTNPDRYIIIGSHLDSPESAVGATDGASGQGIQVEMARILAKSDTNKTILLVGFGGEMLWFRGSEYFVNKHPDVVKNCDAMMDINVAGAGENVAPIDQSDLPETVVADPKLLKLLQECANELENPLTISQDAYPSDTFYFYKFRDSQVPVVQIESRPFKVPAWSSENTPDKLDLEDMSKVGQTLIMATLKLSNFRF